jgi:hypothetical protein
MAATFEQMVQTINRTSSPFELVDDLQVFRDGLNDLARRLEALEQANRASHAGASTPAAR